MNLDPAMLERMRGSRTAKHLTRSLTEPKARHYRELSRTQRVVKRAMDVVLAMVGLLLFATVLPLIALLIKLDSRGPIFYHQVRVGINRRERDPLRRNPRATSEGAEGRGDSDASSERRKIVAEGRTFRIYKLRSMYVNSESDGVRWAQKNDSRVTRVGHYLRLTRLDEFPQFWNVLRGDMSIVGPRPERPPFITLLQSEVPGYLERLRFKPGITGLAQVESGYDESIESVQRKVDMDLRYMNEYSLLMDLKILWRSVRVVFTGDGAY